MISDAFLSGTTGQVGVEDQLRTPSNIGLHQNFPNPFNPGSVIEFDIPTQSHVRVTVYDALGREQQKLLSATMDAGHHVINVDASSWNSGVYFYTLSSGNFSQSKSMVLSK